MADSLPPHRRRRALARPSTPPDRDEWYAEAIRALPPDAPTQPPPSQEAIDSTGSIRVVVNAEGRVREVEIDRNHPRQIASDYEDGDTVNALSFHATEEELASAVRRIIDAEDALADFSYFPDGAWPAAIERP